MLPRPLIDIVNAGSAYAVRLGHHEAGVAHLVMAAVDADVVKAWLRERGLAHHEVRQQMLDHLEKAAVKVTERDFSLSDLVIAALQSALTDNPKAGAAEFMAAVWSLADDGTEEWQAVQRLKSMRPPVHAPARLAVSALATWCTDMVAMAARGSYDPVIGRDAEIERLEQILSRRKKNNPILLGEAGVGKTSIVEALAMRLADGETAEALREHRVHCLDVVGLLSGTRDRGDLELRLKHLMEELAADPKSILFIDEIHVLSGAVGSAGDVANLIKPALSSGRVRCIGATTHAEFARYVESDPAFARRFQPLAVPEPSVDDTVIILNRIVPSYAGHHGVSYDKASIRAAVDMSVRFVVGRQLPDKAIDLLDECGSIAATTPERRVTRETVAAAISRMSGLGFIRDPELGKKLAAKVKGQDGACVKIAETVTRSVADIGTGNPVRCMMLFEGPERSGKKHAANTLASIMSLPIHVINMADFSEAHSVSGLFGPPPGYVGFGMGGKLTEPVRRTPACVLVLDRIDQAHPAVMAAVLSALEKGDACDSANRRASFAAATVIMTSVKGTTARPEIGFTRKQQSDAPDGAAGIDGLYDSVIRFSELDRDALKAMAQARISVFLEQMKAGGYRVDITGDVAETVVNEAEMTGGGAVAVERAFRKIAADAVSMAADMTVRMAAGIEKGIQGA